MKRSALRAPRNLTFMLALLGTALSLGAVGLACDQLLGGLGLPNAVQCNITGTAVGFDGGVVRQVDANWYPEEDTGTSSNIQGTLDGADFKITTLTAAQGSNRVVGELAIGEAPTPPLPLKYGAVRIPIDLEAGSCTMDLGEVVLPERGSADDETPEDEVDAGVEDDNSEVVEDVEDDGG